VKLLLEIHDGCVAGTASRAHVVLTPRALDHGRYGARDAQRAVFDHGVGLGHAFVHLGRHVVEELAVAALDKHLGDGRHARLGRRGRRPSRNARLQLHVFR
jgi:hypothetical protein